MDFDSYLKKHLPHDGEWRHAEFNVKINKDGKLEFSSRNLMTGQEWYDRFEKEFMWPEQDPSELIEEYVLNAAKKAAGIK